MQDHHYTRFVEVGKVLLIKTEALTFPSHRRVTYRRPAGRDTMFGTATTTAAIRNRHYGGEAHHRT
jgi:hypothetical protein